MPDRPAAASSTPRTIGILIALLLYALSPAPMIRLLMAIYKDYPPEYALNPLITFYTPLFYVVEHVGPLKDFYRWYENVWGLAYHG